MADKGARMDVIGDPAERDGGRPPRRRLEGWHGDFVHALTDGLIALGTAVVVAVLGVVILRYAWAGHLHGGAGDYVSLGAWLTGASLGVPLHMTASTTFGPGHSLDEHLQLRAIVWLLTAIVLILIYLLARRRERVQPSTGSALAAVRALLTALVVTAALLVLSLVTKRPGVFGTTFYGTLKTTSLGEGITPVGGTYSVGIFGSHRVWIVWLLLAAAVAGTLVPALLARLDSIDLPITGAWRAAVTGLAVGVAEVLFGEISAASSTSGVVTFSAAGGSFHESVSAGPSLLAAAGLSALWFALGYLAAAVAVRRRCRQAPLSAGTLL